MTKTTPQKHLPDYLCATFALDRGVVYCYWKGGDNCTWLFFYLEDTDDPEIPEDEYRDLVSVEFDYVVRDRKEAEALAKKTWGKHKEQILSTTVGRLYVKGDELVEWVDWERIMSSSDIRMTKLIYRNILCQREDWAEDLARLEGELQRLTGNERDRCVEMIEMRKKDIAYLNALLAVEYPD